MLTIGGDGFDSLLLPLTIGALLMALLRALVAVCSRATAARDARAIALTTRVGQALAEEHEKRTD